MSVIRSIVFFLFFMSTAYGQIEIYELRVYELEFFKPSNTLHEYFEKALIPALNRQGIKNVGAFEEWGDALPKKIYLLIPYPDLMSHQRVADALWEDEKYKKDADAYFKASPSNTAFKRYKSSLVRSASGFPELVTPDEDAELFELRIYESHNEDALRRKVDMFNRYEFDIFEEVGLTTVFFGSDIAGGQMPCLTYMLAFRDMVARDLAWSKFIPHPEWQRITKLDEYKDAMSDITRVFLKPLNYSQL